MNTNNSNLDFYSEKIAEKIISEISSDRFLSSVADRLCLGSYPLLVDPLYYLMQNAAKESANFIQQHIDTAVLFRAHYPPDRFWSHCLSLVNGGDLFLEFGVYSGKSINYFAELKEDVIFHGFDSFEGLPSDWNGWVAAKGHFKRDCMPDVRNNVLLHKGWFHESIPEFVEKYFDKKIAFLHIDCDLYESTKTVFDMLGYMLQKNSIIVFDEYLNYPAWKNHEHKAFVEFCNKYNVKFTYKAFYSQKACVQIDSIG